MLCCIEDKCSKEVWAKVKNEKRSYLAALDSRFPALANSETNILKVKGGDGGYGEGG